MRLRARRVGRFISRSVCVGSAFREPYNSRAVDAARLPRVEGELWMIIPRADSSSSNRLLQEISYCYPIRLLLHSKSSRNSFVLVHYPSNRVGVVAPI